MPATFRRFWLPFALWLAGAAVRAQPVPGTAENLDFVVTFGPQADPRWGDDGFAQVFFFLVPETRREALYVRVFDPDCGGRHDEARGRGFGDTRTEFALYGGAGAHSDAAARQPRPGGDYRAGTLLARAEFGAEAAYDNKWYTFGPLDPLSGEPVPEFGGRVFKLVCRGLRGDDGNAYRYFLSGSATQNVPVEGGNAFAYGYSFRLPAAAGATAHLYPFVNDQVVSVKQSNFDLDGGATLRVFSVAKNGHPAAVSADGQWASSVHPIAPAERGFSLDLRLTTRTAKPNDLVFFVTNQYGTALPFFAVPLGGPPRFRYQVEVKYAR